MVSADFRRQLEGLGLTTANILYRMPDHPGILQRFIWQRYDLHPHFPELRKFLDFWSRQLEGPLHSVTVAHAELICAIAGEGLPSRDLQGPQGLSPKKRRLRAEHLATLPPDAFPAQSARVSRSSASRRRFRLRLTLASGWLLLLHRLGY
jgi:uncharacterized protein Usg